MEDVGQNPLDGGLERENALSVGRVPERDDFSEVVTEKEEALRNLELETAKLEKKKKILSKNVMELQEKIREAQVKLQKTTESCMQQEKGLAKINSDYQFVYELCEDQAHYIKKYQEILRKMEKEKEVLLFEKEISKAQNNSSQVVKPGTTLVDTIQSNMEKKIIKKQKRMFWFRHFQYPFSLIMIFIWLLGYMFFHSQYINPHLLVDTLPMLMSRSNLKWLTDIVFPFLTLEMDDVLPH
ncbi:transmembrane and coiled-coil domain-containing protein 5B-like [Nannospalax galili]|uniref:transmembrane and coiled-coil domain-containing protein 5B-like n=1 Tax=Nannospalax galili TaxID=1026970 RepID=UPI0004ED5C14|nr:transmembrane and coiled-coil domain-containing protein 5B-like [Nannospalax galili]